MRSSSCLVFSINGYHGLFVLEIWLLGRVLIQGLVAPLTTLALEEPFIFIADTLIADKRLVHMSKYALPLTEGTFKKSFPASDRKKIHAIGDSTPDLATESIRRTWARYRISDLKHLLKQRLSLATQKLKSPKSEDKPQGWPLIFV